MRSLLTWGVLAGAGVLTTFLLRAWPAPPVETAPLPAPPAEVPTPPAGPVEERSEPEPADGSAQAPSLSDIIRRCPLDHLCLDGGEDPRAVPWRRGARHPPGMRPLQPPYAAALGPLEPLADAGDPAATLMLYELLEGCRHAYRSEQALNDALETMAQTHRLPWPGDQELRVEDASKRERMAHHLRRAYEDCRDVPKPSHSAQLARLARVAQGPYSQVKLTYAQQVQDPLLKETLLRDAWALGDPNALYPLVMLLSSRYEQGLQTNGHIEAAAAMTLFASLQRAAFPPDPQRVMGRHVDAMLQATDARLAQLRPHEREEATRLAVAMLDGGQCCLALD